MPSNTNPIFLATRRSVGVEIDPADTTDAVDLIVAGSNGTLIESIAATTDDTSDVELDLILYDGADSFALGSATIPAGAGTDGGTSPAADILNQTDLPWVRDELIIAIESGCTLQVAAHATITAAKAVHIVAFAGDY